MKAALQQFGGQAGLARALNLRQPSVWKWVHGRVPAERAVEIERATGGKISRAALRPDLFGDAAASTSPAS
jgi:DNA-binding transcriptional regulator YdaS (Cro superfamily)